MNGETNIPPSSFPEPTVPLRRLRTYKSDVAESIKSERQSLARMVVAEKRKQEERIKEGGFREEAEEKKFFTRKMLFITGGVFLAAIALALLSLLFIGGEETQQPTALTPSYNPIFNELDTRVSLPQINENEIRRASDVIKGGARIPLGNILRVVFTKTVPTEAGTAETTINTSELLRGMPNDAPEQLLRTLNPEFFFGFHSLKTIAPFLIMTNRFYDGAFVGMLNWEKFMAHDLAPLFLLNPIDQQNRFEDAVIKNIDVRFVRNAQGEAILLYSFIDRETIVIATNADTFAEIVTRVQTPRPLTR